MRLGEKTAAEIAKIYAASSNDEGGWIPKENPFSGFSFQHQRKPKSSTTLEQHSQENVSKQTMSTHPSSSEKHPDNIKEEGDFGKDRVPKLVGENEFNQEPNSQGEVESGKLTNSYVDHNQNLKSIVKQIKVNATEFNIADQITGESKVVITKTDNTSSSKIGNKPSNKTEISDARSDDKDTTNSTKTSNNFQIKKHNVDGDSHTWRPLKIDSAGDMKPENSVLLHKNGQMMNITGSDSWIPNSGPITTERD